MYAAEGAMGREETKTRSYWYIAAAALCITISLLQVSPQGPQPQPQHYIPQQQQQQQHIPEATTSQNHPVDKDASSTSLLIIYDPYDEVDSVMLRHVVSLCSRDPEALGITADVVVASPNASRVYEPFVGHVATTLSTSTVQSRRLWRTMEIVAGRSFLSVLNDVFDHSNALEKKEFVGIIDISKGRLLRCPFEELRRQTKTNNRYTNGKIISFATIPTCRAACTSQRQCPVDCLDPLVVQESTKKILEPVGRTAEQSEYLQSVAAHGLLSSAWIGGSWNEVASFVSFARHRITSSALPNQSSIEPLLTILAAEYPSTPSINYYEKVKTPCSSRADTSFLSIEIRPCERPLWPHQHRNAARCRHHYTLPSPVLAVVVPSSSSTETSIFTKDMITALDETTIGRKTMHTWTHWSEDYNKSVTTLSQRGGRSLHDDDGMIPSRASLMQRLCGGGSHHHSLDDVTVVISIARNLSVAGLPFLFTFARNHPPLCVGPKKDITVMLLLVDNPEAFSDVVLPNPATVMFLPLQHWAARGAALFPRLRQCKLVISRFPMLWTLLETVDSRWNPGRVMISDARDVVFGAVRLRNAMEEAEQQHNNGALGGVGARAQEFFGVVLEREFLSFNNIQNPIPAEFNLMWLRKAFGSVFASAVVRHAAFAALGQEEVPLPIPCAGIMLGSPKAMLAALHLLTTTMSQNKKCMTNDQGALVGLVVVGFRVARFPFSVVLLDPHSTRFTHAMSMHDIRWRIDLETREEVLVNCGDQPYAVMHQIDRLHTVWPRLHKIPSFR